MAFYTLSNIDTTFSCYQMFTNFFEQVKNLNFEEITISLNHWFCANMSAVLAGLLDKLDITNSIHITSDKEQIITILKKNGFLAYYGYQSEEDNFATTCRHLKLSPTQGRFFNLYVLTELLNKQSFPEMSNELQSKIAESINEVFENAKMHSQTENIYTCGQYFPKKHKIEFTIVDTGIGIKEKINTELQTNLSSVQAIKWAIKSSNTTKKDVPGGLGLAVLTDFIKINGGKIQIVSDDGFLQISNIEENYQILENPFPGTVINMEIKTDTHCSYSLSTEVDINNIF